MCDSGDLCGARNTQFEQEFLDLFRAETVSAYDWRDRIGDFCVADYLAELYDARDEIFYTKSVSTCAAIYSHAPARCLRCFAETSSRRDVSRFGLPTEGLQPKSCLRVYLGTSATRLSGLSLRGLNLICRNAAQISNKS
jgi:hypothetical protein